MQIQRCIAAAAFAALWGFGPQVATAQNDSIVWISSSDHRNRSNGNGNLAVANLDSSEMSIVTPEVGVEYDAGPYLPTSASFLYVGYDGVGEWVDSSTTGTWGIIDGVFVKRVGGPANPTVHDVYQSFATTTNTDMTAVTLFDSDILRFPSNFDVEIFLLESDVRIAVGGTDIDIDAICQDDGGNLYLSFSDTETINGTSQPDGSIFYIAAADITYDANGDVTALAPGSAQLLASEADVDAWVANAGAINASGATLTSVGETDGLELDPNGGMVAAPQIPGLMIPNLLIGSGDLASDYVLFSTSGGGSVAVINGVQMGSTTSPTLGFHMGTQPDSAGGNGIRGLGLIPETRPFVLKNNTQEGSLFISSQVAGATPFAPIAFFLTFPDLGDRFSIATIPGFGGELLGAGTGVFPLLTAVADEDGYASQILLAPPSAAGTGVVAFQALDLAGVQFAVPAAFDFE